MSLDKFSNKNLIDGVNRNTFAIKWLTRGADVATDPKFKLCDTLRALRAVL